MLGVKEPDSMDAVVGAWSRERPDLDLQAIGVVGRLGRLVRLLGPAQERVLATFGLQNGEFDVLATLRRAGDPYTLTPSQLSKSLLLTRAGMTSRIDRLESAQLVERELDRRDRRSFRVRLTDAGFRAVDDAMTAHTANVTNLMSALSKVELDSLQELLHVLLRDVEGREDKGGAPSP